MEPDASCTSDSWTVLTSASTNSQLAGVLGGFLITAIALLFDRTTRDGVHTLALFASARADPDARQLPVQPHHQHPGSRRR
jgi:hypothetical protein